ncbi:MAG: mechanosensitive ion channel [Flavobacteriales bacterium]|jgi:small-conductance mechanosensitive channel|nr:mechanosensitive ion channel [Flavobacteriales bacterium]
MLDLSERAIDVGGVNITWLVLFRATAILLLAAGTIWVIGFLVRQRVRHHPETKARLHSLRLLLTYLIWLVAIVSALRTLGIDVTYMLAGSAALLVGLGLGLQQTFNDIVSGIIILLEGTIRVGDVLELEGLVGRVTEIKLRTSTVNSRDGMNVIVPNHRFINENVVNWTHNNMVNRFRITVGVAYGSDEQLVHRVLKDCAERHAEVITNEPEKAVLVRLIGFGDSSLDFELLFWSRNAFRIEQTKSDIRFAILKAFREAGVTIPFPQRDVHLIPFHTNG